MTQNTFACWTYTEADKLDMDHADKGLATCTRQEKKHLAGEFQENAPESDTSPN